MHAESPWRCVEQMLAFVITGGKGRQKQAVTAKFALLSATLPWKVSPRTEPGLFTKRNLVLKKTKEKEKRKDGC